MELFRIVPVFCSAGLAVLTVAAFSVLGGWFWLVGGLVLLGVGALACVLSIVAKWVLVGRHHAGEHPLWSGFVWRNELADTFVEVVAVPWLAGSVPGTPVMSAWLRGLGAHIGKGSGWRATGCPRRTW